MKTTMEHEAYHADTTRIGKSGLDLIRKSPAHYWARYLDPNREREEPTAALQLGTAVHHAVLEPHEFERRYQVLPEINKRTTAGKAEFEALMEHAKANGITFLLEDDRTTCLRMRDAVHKHHAAKLLLAEGVAEETVFWTDPETGAKCKCKRDWFSGTGFITDLKTTTDASPEGFPKSVINYRYHVQSAFYYDGHRHAFGAPPEGFAFIAVEKEPPYAVGVYYMTETVYKLGRKEYLTDLETYTKCLASNEWPAYSNDFVPLELPTWATRNI